MIRKRVIATLTVALLALVGVATVYLPTPTEACPLDMAPTCRGIVDKQTGESFTAKISFKNKGSTEGTWEIAVTFEGDEWSWIGEAKPLTLEASETQTLEWEGAVPDDAQVDSVARLVVYYDDNFNSLNWWIRVVSGAELGIVHSEVS